MTKHRIAAIPSDGIGKERVPEGLRVLDAAATKYDIPLQWDHFDLELRLLPEARNYDAGGLERSDRPA